MASADPQLFQFRDLVRQFSPWWLQTGTALKLLYVIGLHCDVLAQMAVEGVRRRFAGADSYDSLALIGRERRIVRGRAEPAPTYASRVQRCLDAHRLRGGPYPMLRLIYAHYAADRLLVWLRYYSGRQYAMDLEGAIVRSAS